MPDEKRNTWKEILLENAMGMYPVDDLTNALADLGHRFGTFMDWPVSDPMWDDREFERDNPGHPLASSYRFRRQRAAGFFLMLAEGEPSLVTEEALDALHRSLFDCSAAVRYDLAMALGYLNRPASVAFLEKLIATEPSSANVIEVARLASSGRVAEVYGSPAGGGGFIADRRFLGQRFGLEISAGRPQAVAENGSSAEVTPDEFLAFQEDGELPARLAQLSNPDPAVEAGDGFDVVRAQVPEGLSVLLDTTTIRNAVGALEKGVPSPLALLDLATLSTAIACFDNVLVQSFGARIARAAELGIRVLDCPRDFIAGPLWSICAKASNQLRENEERRDHIEAAWAEFLGWHREEARLGLHSWDGYQDSPYYWNGIVAGHYSDSLFGRRPDRKAREFLDIQTMRSLVNHELASRLSVPYLAAGLRSPVQSVIIRENHERQLIIDRLIQKLAPPEARTPPTANDPYSLEYTAPFILALALEQMSSPADYWPVIARYRSRFSPLRQRLRTDLYSWDGRHGTYARRMLRSLKTTTEIVDQAEQSTIDVSATLVSGALGGVAGASASLGFKLISLAKPADHVMRCYYRWFRPELYLLSGVRDEASNLRALDHRIQHIWKGKWSSGDYRQLDMLLAANPAKILRFGEVR